MMYKQFKTTVTHSETVLCYWKSSDKNVNKAERAVY